ncbi:MAG TPA: chorismate mutase [Bryobacteraceae bacterium]|nr:chorismate mutase [Bryobacteraceae bacterium]
MRALLLPALCAIAFAQPSTDLNQALKPSRERINSIDDRIVKLLNERAQVVRDVGEIKKRYRAPASAPGREEQVLKRVGGQARAPLTDAAVEAIYKTILREMSAMEAVEMKKASKAPEK